ncbi:peroxiredoxin Q/BCP [Metschnikowia aff. pulcherrima]|uniref:thioredoxin-dependent peroxiredoxin n=1 Tax=Metschnikowia aff. pulcherrima TaxID=2163413 RepID=A0A4P6XNF9_9ASCO|nr:peroxiredoxin Q/BCP [Metschnikowia aff. pulcherrima]
MPELRRSTRASTVEATKRLEEPPVKKAKTSAAEKKSATKTETESEVNELPKPAENEFHKQKSAELEVGDEIPDLTLLDENENEVSLKEVAQKSKFLVIFAYPKASTPGCTKQAAGFQRNYSDLQALDTAVYGLSADSPKSQMSFVTKQGLKYPLLSDPSRKLISVLGAKKSPSGVKRSHWIFVDGKLTIKKIQISPDVSVDSALKDVQRLEQESGDANGAKEEEGKDSKQNGGKKD